MLSKTISLIIAILYVTIECLQGDGETAFKSGASLIFPLSCIWFSEALGRYTGGLGRGAITQSSPGCMVAFLGWVLLLLPMVIKLTQA